MIKVFYKKRLICYIAKEGVNMAQVQACMEIAADKMNVLPSEIGITF